MPEDGSSEAASFGEDSPGNVSWGVYDDHHPAITEEILDLWERNVVPLQPGIRPEMRLNIVPSLLVNCNVRLSRLKFDQGLDRRCVHAVLFENRYLFLTYLILPDTGQQGHFSLAKDSRCCNRNIPAFSSRDPVDSFHDHLFPGPGKSLDEEVDVPVESSRNNEVQRQTMPFSPSEWTMPRHRDRNEPLALQRGGNDRRDRHL